MGRLAASRPLDRIWAVLILTTLALLAMQESAGWLVEYPDAWVVHTHRDPLKTEPSSLSTLATVRWERSEDAELPEAGGAGLGDMMILLAGRRSAGDLPDRIVDSHFSDLMADPAAAVEKLYGQMGRPFLGEHADAIRAYIASKPKGKFGKHRYSAEEWGFDPAALREKMKPYTDHYGVALED